jgi:hypothetical protein
MTDDDDNDDDVTEFIGIINSAAKNFLSTRINTLFRHVKSWQAIFMYTAH